tara:strand:+ start:2840 stop:4993 length:2154 start_codon:yes stop_codon:yes gene_type:complete
MGKTVALYGGGFKPPTRGHFEVVKTALDKFSEIDEFQILVGSGEREGIDQAESLLVWDVYKNYLPQKLSIIPSNAPIGAIKKYAKENPDKTIYFILGTREGHEGDAKDIKYRTKNIEKEYPNLKVKVIETPDRGISGTSMRKSLNQDPPSKENIISFLPSELTAEEQEEIFDIIRPGKINENATYSNHIDYKKQIIDLTKHMLDQGKNITPLPKVVFKHGDSDNAENFLGKTAYYDPETSTIVLYTEGRHPKDIVRSFAHEMIHHIQNLEDRLDHDHTTNTNEDDKLVDIEKEAYLDGNMTFRGWTDSLQEYKDKDHFDLITELQLNEGRYDKITTDLSRYTLNAWKDDFEDGANEGRFEITVGPGNDYNYADLKFHYAAVAKFTNTYQQGGAAYPQGKRGYDDGANWPVIELDYYLDVEDLPQAWEKISMSIRNTIRHEIEHLTQSGINVKQGKEQQSDYEERQEIKTGKKKWWKIWRQTLGTPDYYKLAKEVDANLQGLYFKAKKQRLPFKEVVKDYLEYLQDISNLTDQDKQEIITIWRERAPKLNLPILENQEEEKNYTIYSDMDGVLVDFDTRFKEFSDGIEPQAYVDQFGLEKFWELIDEKIGVRFWVGMDWMSDGLTYWDYIKKYNPILLSAPSRHKHSQIGKRMFAKKKLPTSKLILAFAHQKKDYADENSILIDDRKKNIDQWRAAGGIGILHTDAASTIEKLKELGL